MSITRARKIAGTSWPLEVARRSLARIATWIGALGRGVRFDVARPTITPNWARFAAGVIPFCVVVAATMLVLDAAAIKTIRSLPPWLTELSEQITGFGTSGWFLWPVGLLLVAIASLTRPSMGKVANLVAESLAARLGFLFLAIGTPGLIVSIVKRLIGRVRPSDYGPFHYMPLAWRPDYASMPSGHATAAFAAAIAVGAVWPRARVPMWIYALIIALSRIIVAAHYPSDVLVGCFVGVGGALMIRRFFATRRLGFFLGSDGRVHPLPGPSRRRLEQFTRRLLGHDHVARA